MGELIPIDFEQAEWPGQKRRGTDLNTCRFAWRPLLDALRPGTTLRFRGDQLHAARAQKAANRLELFPQCTCHDGYVYIRLRGESNED